MSADRWQVTYQANLPEGATQVLAPSGLETPHAKSVGFEAKNASLEPVLEETTNQSAWLVTPEDGQLNLTYSFEGSAGEAYNDAIFVPHPSRYSRVADELIDEVAQIAPDAKGLDRAIAIACATAEKFTYGHPLKRFNDGMDAVPALGCGLTEGSCVDINTYFLASLRAAGIEAGYITGFFFPAEKGDHCEDGHCWVVTRIDGQTHEWDIAHHLKMGTRNIRPALNPKPGQRAACFFGMGLAFPSVGQPDVKALIEPIAIAEGNLIRFAQPRINLIK